MGSCGLDSPGSGQAQWRAILNKVINFRDPEKAGNFVTN
jgi:hypothetical protein